ncbi:MAG: hypothetical protein ACPG56_04530 [Flavobacteriales bacterium]
MSPVWKVVVFLAPLCPICQDYTYFLNALHNEWAAAEAPVELVGVFPEGSASLEDIEGFADTYGVTWPLQLDLEGAAVDLNARWTPEVFVLDTLGRVHYRGRVNDLYVSLGKHRPKPKRHDLRDAVAALLAGQAPPDSVTQAIGCPIE